MKKFGGFEGPAESEIKEENGKIEPAEKTEARAEIKHPEKVREQKENKRSPEEVEKRMERIKSLRLTKEQAKEAVEITPEKNELIKNEEERSVATLDECHDRGFGISPSGNPNENFYGTLWSRDLAHAGGNFYAQNNPEAALDSLRTTFRYQKPDGSLPYRVEKVRFLLEHTPQVLLGIDFKWFKKIGIDLITRKTERPVYEGEDGGNAEDTIPATVIAIGELFINSKEGREFVKENFENIKKAMDQFIGRTDPADGLEVPKKANPDWADSLYRGGKKMGTINVLASRALRMMELMSKETGREEEAKYYGGLEKKVKASVMEKLYDKEDHYFRTAEGEDRIDAVASIFGSLYMLPATKAAKVEETMSKHLKSPSGLKNFYPPYPKEKVFLPMRIIGMGGYHNESVWPWVTAQNIQVKIKIALEHPDEKIREQYKKEAVEDLADLAKLFKEAGGAYEVFDPNTRQPKKLRTGFRSYKVPKNLMGNLAAWNGAYSQLKNLGWIK